MIRPITVLIAAGVAFIAAGAQAGPLERELASILVDHPQIQGALKNIEATRYGIDRARAPMSPSSPSQAIPAPTSPTQPPRARANQAATSPAPASPVASR
jgi:hypothetical protein